MKNKLTVSVGAFMSLICINTSLSLADGPAQSNAPEYTLQCGISVDTAQGMALIGTPFKSVPLVLELLGPNQMLSSEGLSVTTSLPAGTHPTAGDYLAVNVSSSIDSGQITTNVQFGANPAIKLQQSGSDAMTNISQTIDGKTYAATCMVQQSLTLRAGPYAQKK